MAYAWTHPQVSDVLTLCVALATFLLAIGTIWMARSVKAQAEAATRALKLQIEALLITGGPSAIKFLNERIVMGGESCRVTPVLVKIQNAGNGVAQITSANGSHQGELAHLAQYYPTAIRGGESATIELWFKLFNRNEAFCFEVRYEGGDGVEAPPLQFRYRSVGKPTDDQITWKVDLDHPLPPPGTS